VIQESTSLKYGPASEPLHISVEWLTICDALLTGFRPEDKGPYAFTPNTVELIPTLGALFPRGGPVQDPVLTTHREQVATDARADLVGPAQQVHLAVRVPHVAVRGTAQEMCCATEAGSYLRLRDSCLTQLKAQGPSRTCNESKEGEEEVPLAVRLPHVAVRGAAPYFPVKRLSCHGYI